MRAWLTLIAFSAWLVCGVTFGAESQHVTITLKLSADAPTTVVLLKDIATVTCDSEATQSAWEELDIADCEMGCVKDIKRGTIEMRAQLEGLDLSVVQWRGAEICATKVVLDSRQDQVSAAVARAAAEALSLSDEDVKVSLTSPVKWTKLPLSNMPREGVRFEAALTGQPRVGAQQARVAMYIDEVYVEALPVTFQLALYEFVPRAVRSIPRGFKISRDDFVVERALRTIPGSSANPEDILGQTTQKLIPEGQIIHQRDLRQVVVQKDVVIQGRQPVRVIVRKGKLEVALAGAEALDAGREGDWIRVKNPQTNRIVRGRVIDDSTVIVQ